jgi:PadR family transcriptional regulator PadR
MSTEPVTALPKNFIRPCLLLLLREQPAHGYDLVERLRPFGFARDDPGRLYRSLRGLENEGLVHSAWEKSQTGPDRRIYQLTRAGAEALHEEVKAVVSVSETLEAFLGRYEEFVAVPRRSAAAVRR